MSRMRRSGLAFLVVVMPVAGLAAEPVAAVKPADWKPRRASVEAEKPRPPVASLIEKLGSPKFVDRATATRELARGGLPAVSALREAAVSGNPEVSIRAVVAMENLWLRAMDESDDPTADAALGALDELSVSGSAAQRGRIEALLAAYAPQIQKFAVDEIRRLGGTVRYNESILEIDEVTGATRPQIQYVVIGTAWAGGEEGLRHIRRAGPSGVYFIRGTKLPEGAAERFEVAAGIPVQIRGPAYLGVRSASLVLQGVEGCLVDSAEPGTPAAKAGVRQGDLIVAFNGKKIVTFEQLVKEIEQTKPGQTVDAVVRRIEPSPDLDRRPEATEVTLKVTMEEWK